MTSEEKYRAMHTLDPFKTCIKWSEYTHKWFVHTPAEIGDGVTLTSPTEHASSIGVAIDLMWDRLTRLEPDKYLVLNAVSNAVSGPGKRRHLRWNGFMWEDAK